MVLVDTNVLFALLVANTPWSSSARELFARDPEWWTESHAFPELTNILVRYVRVGEVSPAQAFGAMTLAIERLGERAPVVRHDDALRAALHFKASGYDARFLVLADQFRLPLVTEDAKLRKVAPALTRSLSQALAA